MLSKRLYNASIYDGYTLCEGKSIDVNESGIITNIGDYDSGDYDCKGLVCIPAFTDGMVNLPSVEVYRLIGVDLHDCNTLESYIATINAANDARRGYGWNVDIAGEDGAMLLKRMLDDRYPNDPAYLYSDDMSCVVVNDAFLDMVDIESIGLLDTIEINKVVRSSNLFDIPKAMIKMSLISLQERLLSMGITAIRVCNTYLDKSIWKCIDELVKEDKWKIYVLGYVNINYEDTVEQARAKFDDALTYQNRSLEICGITLDLDSSIDTGQAALFKPYENTDCLGDLLWDFDHLVDIVKAFDESERININAYGDRAVASALRCFESVTVANGSRRNKTISKSYLMSSYDVDRCSKLGVSVCVEPCLIPFADSFYEADIDRLGINRARSQYRFGTLISKGVSVFSGNTTNLGGPIKGIYNACRRVGSDDVTSYMALNSFTSTMFNIHDLEFSMGTLACGCLANLILINKDIYNMKESRICDAKVCAAFIDGDLVWSR